MINQIEKIMKQNRFNNIICLLIGAILSVFVYTQLFMEKNIKPSIKEVEKIVQIENTDDKQKIKQLEEENNNFKQNPSIKTIYVDKPVEKIIYVDKPFETIKEVEKTIYVDKPVEKIIYVDKPFETIKEVEKTIYVDKPVEKIIYVDKPVEIEKIIYIDFFQLLLLLYRVYGILFHKAI